jgi:hypothetical protein
MAEVHLPHLDEEDEEEAAAAPPAPPPAPIHRPRARSILKFLLEILLIATGVFLGLAGEQWREHAHRKELAQEALRRFRTEIETNRKAVAAVKDYHATMQQKLTAYLRAKPEARKAMSVELQGIEPAAFEHTAWDLAIATQSLNDIDRDLAFALSRMYAVQQNYDGLSRGILQAMYVRTPTDEPDAFLATVHLYYADITLMEPRMLAMYDDLLPRIDHAVGE